VYVTGSVKHPGVYTLSAGARVYQLLQVAGGALPQADLVSLNLAAPLTDGQEVYVLAIGESPPTYQGGVPGPGTNGTATTTQTGQAVNLNTATLDQMRQVLHVSSATAQKIIDYRTQHGPYTSVDQLLQVVSRSIYDKIKNSVTV
jgi:competence protein ComEA